jgi:hypothetical protein
VGELENRAQYEWLGCFDTVELRTLTAELEETYLVDPDRGPAMLALGRSMLEGCIRQEGDIDGCPFVPNVTALRDYVDSHEEERQEYAAMRGVELRRYPLEERHTTFVATVDKAASEAYFLYSRATGLSYTSIRENPGSCAQMTIILQQTLRERGIDTQVMQFYEKPFFFHYFLRSNDVLDETFYIDPTWQQFLSKEETDFNSLPRTLILPTSRLDDAVSAHSLPGRWKDVWSHANPEPVNWHAFYDKGLDSVFATKGWT